MLQAGIYRRDQVQALSAQDVSEVVCSFRLLKVPHPATPADVEIFEKVIRKTRLSNLVYRTTYRGRMAEVDEAVSPILLSIFDPGQELAVEDRAASDSLVSSEWAERLWTSFPNASLTASDLHCHLIEASRPGRGAYVFEEGGAPLQHVIPPFVIPFVRPLPARWLAARLVSVFSRRGIARAWKAAQQAHWDDFLDDRAVEVDGWEIARIRLIHPDAIALSRRDPRFRLQPRSIFDVAPPAHVLRSMNILNAHYFAEPDLRRAVRAIFDSLTEGGVWIIGRTREETSPPENHVSIWQKKDGAFHLLHRLRDGSEIDHLIGQALSG
jgi:hypothetical protein